MKLQKYKNYTVDYRLKQFRRVSFTKKGFPGKIEFLNFDSEKGDRLLGQMIKKNLVPDNILSELF
jgi:hypothetical protein